MKKSILSAIALTTLLFSAGVMLSGGSPVPVIILGGFVFLLVLGLMNPPAKRNLSQKEKQDSLMRALGAGLPPDEEDIMQETEEKEGNSETTEDKD